MNRRDMLKITSASALGVLTSGNALAETVAASTCQYDAFEVSLKGPSTGNPFIDVQLKATFLLEHRTVVLDGFYDGDGNYKIRFIPDTLGEWRYTTTSNASSLNQQTGGFLCTAPKPGNHGPVSVRRFWLGVIAGCYVTHGETYLNAGAGEDENDKIWWSNGGRLSGSSPARIGFLRKLLEETTTTGLEASPEPYYLNAASFVHGEQGLESKASPAAILYYFDFHQPIQYTFPLGAGSYRAELIDPWQMTIKPIAGSFSGKATLQLPGKPYQAIRFRSA